MPIGDEDEDEKRGVPLPGVFSRDIVTNTVLPRFFLRSSVTLSVTCRDAPGSSVTFLIFDSGIGWRAQFGDNRQRRNGRLRTFR